MYTYNVRVSVCACVVTCASVYVCVYNVYVYVQERVNGSVCVYECVSLFVCVCGYVCAQVGKVCVCLCVVRESLCVCGYVCTRAQARAGEWAQHRYTTRLTYMYMYMYVNT